MAESYTGQVRNGVVVFDGSPPLPEGTKVCVEPLEKVRVEPSEEAAALAELSKLLLSVAGKATGLRRARFERVLDRIPDVDPDEDDRIGGG